METIPLGDSALLIRLRNDFEKAPLECLETVLDARQRLETAKIPGVIDFVPAYTTITLFYEPVRVIEAGALVNDVFGWLTQKIQGVLNSAGKQKKKKRESRLVEIPVCYDREFASDLDEVAQHANISADEVIRLHTAAEYCVNCLGFTPGFGFLSGLDPKLTIPRRSTPRREIAAGSVAIGGKQTGVYALRSPGGWNIIGRTPRCMFDIKREPAALLRTGDRVRFRSITRPEFDSLGE